MAEVGGDVLGSVDDPSKCTSVVAAAGEAFAGGCHCCFVVVDDGVKISEPFRDDGAGPVEEVAGSGSAACVLSLRRAL